MVLDPRLIISALTLFFATVLFLVASERIYADSHASTPPGIEASERSENQTIPPSTTRSEAESSDTSKKQTLRDPRRV